VNHHVHDDVRIRDFPQARVCREHARRTRRDAALDDLGCGVIGRIQTGEVRYVNERILSWTGYLRDELSGHSLSCLIPPELDEILHNELSSEDGGDLHARLTIMRRKDSTTFPVMALPQYHRHDDPDAVHCAVVIAA
jgi:PAS domain S-box-containing protein